MNPIKNSTLLKLVAELKTRNTILSVLAEDTPGTHPVENLKDIQTIVKAGLAPRIFAVGQQIIVPYTYNDVVYDCPFDILGFQPVTLEDGTVGPGMQLGMHYATIESMQFDAPEPTNPDANIQKYGYNRYRDSAMRQWLNSDADRNEWWNKTSDTDVAPAQLNQYKGFMAGFEEEFLSILGNVKIQVAANTVTDGGEIDVMYDKFYLPSLEEMCGVPQMAGVEGSAFEYWKQATGLEAPNNAANVGRIFYRLGSPTTAEVVRLRSAYRGNSYGVWGCLTTGYLYNGNAYNSSRCAPACTIC